MSDAAAVHPRLIRRLVQSLRLAWFSGLAVGGRQLSRCLTADSGMHRATQAPFCAFRFLLLRQRLDCARYCAGQCPIAASWESRWNTRQCSDMGMLKDRPACRMAKKCCTRQGPRLSPGPRKRKIRFGGGYCFLNGPVNQSGWGIQGPFAWLVRADRQWRFS